MVIQLCRWHAALVTGVLLFSAVAPVGAADTAARRLYNNKMTLIGVLREGARQRAIASGDLETLCLILGIGLDVTDRYLAASGSDPMLRQRRKSMQADLNTCLAATQRRTR